MYIQHFYLLLLAGVRITGADIKAKIAWQQNASLKISASAKRFTETNSNDCPTRPFYCLKVCFEQFSAHIMPEYWNLIGQTFAYPKLPRKSSRLAGFSSDYAEDEQAHTKTTATFIIIFQVFLPPRKNLRSARADEKMIILSVIDSKARSFFRSPASLHFQ